MVQRFDAGVLKELMPVSRLHRGRGQEHNEIDVRRYLVEDAVQLHENAGHHCEGVADLLNVSVEFDDLLAEVTSSDDLERRRDAALLDLLPRADRWGE